MLSLQSAFLGLVSVHRPFDFCCAPLQDLDGKGGKALVAQAAVTLRQCPLLLLVPLTGESRGCLSQVSDDPAACLPLLMQQRSVIRHPPHSDFLLISDWPTPSTLPPALLLGVWVPQIVKSVRTETRPPMRLSYIVGSTAAR